MLSKLKTYTILAVCTVSTYGCFAYFGTETCKNIIVIQNTTLVFQCDVNRDFMPFSPPDGQPLTAAILIESKDGSAIPPEISVKEVRITNEDEVWRPKKLEVSRIDSHPSVIEIRARGGPKWKPGTIVTMNISLTDGRGQVHFLRIEKLKIQRSS